MNILVTIPTLEVGGAEIFLARLLNYLSGEMGVKIFLLDFEKEKRDPELIHMFSKKITLLDNPLGNTLIKRILGKAERVFNLEQESLSYKFYERYLKKIVRKNAITIIHSHLYRSDKIIARCITDIPTFTTLHGCYNFFTGTRITEMNSILSTFHQIIYIAERNLMPFELSDKKETLLKKTVKIYNGLALETSLLPTGIGLQNRLPRVVIVSRCIKEKGWDSVIAAVKRLNSTELAVELDLVGDGEYLETLRREHAQERFILFSGKVMNVDVHIARADICCFPSVYPNESLPNSIMEYMMHKKPIITNRIGEVEQMVTMNDGNTCALLAPKDASGDQLIEFYYKEIKELVKNESKRKQLAQMTAENVKKFDIKLTAGAYLKLYNNFKTKN